MSAKEKYNILINAIEKMIEGEESEVGIEILTPHDISDRAFSLAGCEGMDDRSKNVIFLFLSGLTVIEYIQERKMMYAYKAIINSSEWNRELIDSVVLMMGLSDDKAFAKKFKKTFGTSPKKAFANKDESLISPVKDWDEISKDGKSAFISLEGDNMVETRFGVKKDLFMEANIAANLQAFYSLNDDESEYAFSLYKDMNIPLKDTFEYVYNYLWGNFEDDNRGERLIEDLSNPDVLHMYFECNMSFNEIVRVLICLSKNVLPRKMKDTTKEYLLGYREYCNYLEVALFLGEKSVPSFESIYEYYIENRKEDDDEETFILLIERIPYSYEIGRALDDARTERIYKRNNISMDDLIYEAEVYINDSEEDNSYEESLIDEEFSYDIDLDNPEVVEDLYMDNDAVEKYNEGIIDNEDNYWESFNLFCEELDSKENIEKVKNRKLRGYKNLNITDILKQLSGGLDGNNM